MNDSSGFPPFPTHAEEIELVLVALQTVIRGRTAAYVSAPITTGRRFLDWRRHNPSLVPGTRDYNEAHQGYVIAENRAAAISLVSDARARYAQVVDPTSLPDLPGWTQSDYRFLWGEVVRRHAHTVLFADGWEFSTGCVYEFVVGTESAAELLDSKGERLEASRGLQLLEGAHQEFKAHGFVDGPFQQVLSRLRGAV